MGCILGQRVDWITLVTITKQYGHHLETIICHSSGCSYIGPFLVSPQNIVSLWGSTCVPHTMGLICLLYFCASCHNINVCVWLLNIPWQSYTKQIMIHEHRFKEVSRWCWSWDMGVLIAEWVKPFHSWVICLPCRLGNTNTIPALQEVDMKAWVVYGLEVAWNQELASWICPSEIGRVVILLQTPGIWISQYSSHSLWIGAATTSMIN